MFECIWIFFLRLTWLFQVVFKMYLYLNNWLFKDLNIKIHVKTIWGSLTKSIEATFLQTFLFFQAMATGASVHSDHFFCFVEHIVIVSKICLDYYNCAFWRNFSRFYHNRIVYVICWIYFFSQISLDHSIGWFILRYIRQKASRTLWFWISKCVNI